jgi:hypothetical protein
MSIIPEDPIARRRRLHEQQGSTFHQHGVTAADDESGGRFAKQEGARPQVIGTDPIPKYPQLPSGPWSGDDPVPDEPPLGYRIDEMIPLESPTGVQSLSASVATGGPPANEQSEADLAVSFDRGDGVFIGGIKQWLIARAQQRRFTRISLVRAKSDRRTSHGATSRHRR